MRSAPLSVIVLFSAIAACGDSNETCDCPADTVCANGACTGTRKVDCDPSAVPANATAVSALVTVSYSDAGGWGLPAACEWACNTDWYKAGAACINEQQVACIDVAPAHATSTVGNVTVGYTTAGGFGAPPPCPWSCDLDYFETNDTCVDARIEVCTDVAPANATSTFANVVVTYTTAGGWSVPADCAWQCNGGFRRAGMTCVDAPFVVATTPVEGGAVGPGGAIVVDFSEPMNTASAGAAFQLAPSTPGSLAWSELDTRLTFTPTDDLENQVEYTLTVADTATDVAGNALDTTYTVTFRGDAWVMFYGSSGTTNGDLTATAAAHSVDDSSGRAAANALCNSSFATRPAPCAHQVAFLSVSAADQAVDLLDNNDLSPTSEVRTPTGAVVEPTWPELFDGSVQIIMDQHGIYNSDMGYLYWTGSNFDGTFNTGPSSPSACDGWTNGTTGANSQHGWPHETGTPWIARGPITCQNSEHLLCMCW